jgi:hypothetical protein
MPYSGRVARRGRILATKWGMNPNSSSLGVDVTFLLFGATALAVATPIVGALLRWRKPAEVPAPPPSSSGKAS